jgi:hypothetical protein
MNWDNIQQFIRIVLQLAAGFMVQRGLLTEEMAVTATGALMSLAGVAWWMFWNKKRVE